MSYWEQAAQGYANAGHTRGHSLALTRLSQAYHALGYDQKALVSLNQALKLARKSQDQAQIASILGYLGHVHLTLGNLQEAATWLQRALKAAEALQEPLLVGRSRFITSAI